MTLRNVRNGALVLAVVAFVIGIVKSFTDEAPAEGTTIEIGHHSEWVLAGYTVHADTIISTLIAGGAVLLLGLVARRALTRDPDDHVPTKVQMIWEAVVGQVNSQVEDNLGRVHPYVAPLGISLFFFILFANWIELFPLRVSDGTHLLSVPTADTNLTYALAAVTILSVWTYGIRQKGLKGYLKHFFEPFPIMFPLNLLEELIKPITLALRLFGNIFAGGIMLALITLMPIYVLWMPEILWKAFGGAIAVIQAFIFALLTVLYFAMAGAGHGDEHDEHEQHDDADSEESVPVPVS
ncbi:F0F1 ATP synthase subunit A [Nocardioides sp.]|uniref:F0F1 ATP synthase subunit A n=1 Tax=Nocardioides sp. TaxID=35761 RepID=UPI003569D45A